MELFLVILAFACGLVGVIAHLVPPNRNWFAAIGFLGVVLLAAVSLFL